MRHLRRLVPAVLFALMTSYGYAQQAPDTVIEQAKLLQDKGAYRESLSVLDAMLASKPLSQAERRNSATVRAEDLLGQARFDEAVVSAQAALDATAGLSKQEMADTLFLVAKIAASGDASPTEALDKALNAATEADGADGLRVLRVKDRIALVQSTARAADAEKLIRDVIAKAEPLPDNAERDKLRFRNTLGITLVRQSKYDAGREAFALAYEGRLELLSDRHPETLESEHNLGYALRRLGRVQAADDVLSDVLRLRTEVLGADHPDTLVTRTLMVRQLIDKSKFDEAVSESRAITAALVARLGERNSRTLEAMSDMADALFNSGRVSEGVEAARKAYSLAVEVIGESKTEAMNIGHQYAGLLYRSGRFAEALSMYQRILTVTRTLFDDENIDTIATLHNIAAVLSDLGRNDDAIQAYRYCAMVLAKKLPETHPSRLSVQNNLAQALISAGRTDEALEVITDVVRLRSRVLGPENHLTLLSRSNHAAVLAALGRFSEAITEHREVYAIRVRTLGETHPETLKSLHNLASSLGDAGQRAEAKQLFEKVIALRSERLGPRNIATVYSMRALASVLVAGEEFEEARRVLRRVVEASEALRSEGGLPDNLRRSFFATVTPAYKTLSVLEARLGDFDDAVRVAELSKARTLIETSSARGVARNVLPEADRNALSEFEFRIAALDGRIPNVSDVTLRSDLEAQRDGLAFEFSKMDADLRAKYPLYREATDFQLVGGKDAASLLQEDEAFLDFVQGDRDLLLIWINGRGKQGTAILPPLTNLPATLEAYRAALAMPDGIAGLRYPPPGVPRNLVWKLKDGSFRMQSAEAGAIAEAKLVSDIEEIRQELSSWLSNALPADVLQAGRWYISPDGPLASVPLETLKADGSFLVEKHDISSIQSISLMSLSKERVKRYAQTERSQMLAVGDPTYSVAPPSESKSSGIDALRGPTASSSGPLTWPNLPGAAKELSELAGLFSLSAGRDMFSGADASEATVRRLQNEGGLQKYRYVVFSTHGYLDKQNPELSGIVLSQTNLGTNEDGYLRASELSAFDFRSDLVFISACETGVGKWVSGEGILGLPFALFAGGNARTILTLWPVLDGSTAQFVESFFRKVKDGKAPGVALSETKREFIADADEAKRRPVVWAPFVYYGD
ncbi:MULTISPECIES: CHAT domain-containing protein [Bradyrhizobium]|uniref:CHAT domain-containing protein n=1 Tax=Bradyrhizobium TaxID=374 RepID=UPI0009B63A7F|nr:MULTISPECIES: CHAT domain-containing protein [Bradyrhizobium]MCW2130460.1 CHAT domain-containing protein/tetratricopeptide (TPR) repeat protein [Bradyrhizobium elkanii]MCW2175534.1 CHAT domain-containing protein/tetratricopeptide (TPR) repeat protein [Bradyrhizobium elkanii]MDI2108569.1 CHAT domain-containing protein [Bradyrhizobium sp. Mp64]